MLVNTKGTLHAVVPQNHSDAITKCIVLSTFRDVNAAMYVITPGSEIYTAKTSG